jgi:hypothetical protein
MFRAAYSEEFVREVEAENLCLEHRRKGIVVNRLKIGRLRLPQANESKKRLLHASVVTLKPAT